MRENKRKEWKKNETLQLIEDRRKNHTRCNSAGFVTNYLKNVRQESEKERQSGYTSWLSDIAARVQVAGDNRYTGETYHFTNKHTNKTCISDRPLRSNN